jgi:hypothetical protein
MVDLETLRRLALSLPEAVDASTPGRVVYEVAGKGFAWTYMVRTHPRKPRAPQIDVLAVRCEIARKEMLIESAPDRFFDDDHYRGFAGVLVRLAVIDGDELSALLRGGWRMAAPKPLQGRLAPD